MMTRTYKSKPMNPTDLWYAPNARLRTKSATEHALRIVDWIQTGRGLEGKPDEQALFLAMHVCAFRAARPERGTRVSPRERRTWTDRWQIVREHIVEQNVGLAYSMISRFNSKLVDDDDLLSDALFGLTRAVDRFNPFKGFRFSTYACNVIARSLMRRGKQASRYRSLFPVQHDVTFERVQGMPDTEAELYVERLNRALDENLGELTPLESSILAQRFPTDESERLTFRQIGESIGLSKERVRQIQNIALGKLREVLDEDPILQ